MRQIDVPTKFESPRELYIRAALMVSGVMAQRYTVVTRRSRLIMYVNIVICTARVFREQSSDGMRTLRPDTYIIQHRCTYSIAVWQQCVWFFAPTQSLTAHEGWEDGEKSM